MMADAGTARAVQMDTVSELRARMAQLEGRPSSTPVLPVLPGIADLLPGGGLRPGSAYALGSSTSLLFALLARPSQDGSWCAAVGFPDLGAEAAEHAGVALSRLVLVPDPGTRWLTVTATLADVLPVVAVRPPTRARDADIARLAARMRERGTVLLVQGPWPQTEAMLDVSDPRWVGLGDGHGLLTEREVTVTVSSRRHPVPRRGRMLLPSGAGVPEPVRRGVPAGGDEGRMPLRAVS